MSVSNTMNYLNERLAQIGQQQNYVRENMNVANGDDMLEWKRLSMQSGMVRQLMKHDFQIEHNLKKKVLDSFT